MSISTTAARSPDIGDTIKSGQIFRYKDIGDYTYEVFHMDRSCTIRYVTYPDIISTNVHNDNEYWYKFFGIGTNTELYENAYRICMARGSIFAKAVKEHPGIRIIRQDPWECTVSFIISQNNNIPRIKSTIEKLCNICTGGYRFPMPEDIVENCTKIRDNCSLGYRYQYIINIARHVLDKDIDLYALHSDKLGNYEIARSALMKMRGIGPKVADCICLFGLGYTQAIPEDTWIKKLSKIYPDEINALKTDCGIYGGIIQQYLYMYCLDHKDIINIMSMYL